MTRRIGVRAAVEAWFTANRAKASDAAKALGLPIKCVENTLTRMRKERSPVLANVVPAKTHGRSAVIDWFEKNSSTINEAADVLGLSSWSVARVVKVMRLHGMPCVRNVVPGVDRRIYPGDEPSRKAQPGLVEAAIKARTPLEEAWR